MANCDFYGICDKISTEATRNFHNAVGIVLTDISNRTPDPYNPHIPGLRHDDSSCHNPIIYDDPSRMQSAFRNFFQWAESEAHSNAAQYSAYNISGDPIHHAPASSVWRTALYDMEHNDPIDHDIFRDLVNGDYVPDIAKPKVFYPFLARIWRDSTEDFKRVFYAVAAIRSIAVAARWVERRWTALPFGSKSPGNFLKLSYHPGAPKERFFEHTSIAFPHWEVPILIGHDDEVYLDDGVELAYHVSMPPKYREAFLTTGIIH